MTRNFGVSFEKITGAPRDSNSQSAASHIHPLPSVAVNSRGSNGRCRELFIHERNREVGIVFLAVGLLFSPVFVVVACAAFWLAMIGS